jgi:hypothetical protein
VDRGDVALHEAVHACAAAWLGKRVEWIRIAERPLSRSHLVEEGGCRLDPDRDLDKLDAVWLLAAGMFEGNGIARDAGSADHGTWPPRWPITDGKGDRHQLRCLIELLHLTQTDYRDLIAKTNELLAEPALRSWIAKTASALARDGFLTGAEVEALRPANSRTLSIKAEKPIQIASFEC